MRSLAEYVMKGRRQAMTAVLLLGLVPLVNLLSPIMVGLVMLRKGPADAMALFAWAILPLLGWALAGDFLPLLMLFGITGLARLLRQRESWEVVLLAAIPVGVAAEVYLRFNPEPLLTAFDLYRQNLPPGDAPRMSQEDFLGLMPSTLGAGYTSLAVGMLMISRWLQAALYNPGGFKQEFYGLRLTQTVALLLLGLMLMVTYVEAFRSAWALYFAIPLVVAGLALIHAVLANTRGGGFWLFALYLVLPVVVRIVVLLALVDSWYDFRRRFKPPSPPGADGTNDGI